MTLFQRFVGNLFVVVVSFVDHHSLVPTQLLSREKREGRPGIRNHVRELRIIERGAVGTGVNVT